jgi:hypothetical protein
MSVGSTSLQFSHGTQMELYRRYDPMREDPVPPIADPSTSSSTLGQMFGQNVPQASERTGSLEFGKEEIGEMIDVYKSLTQGVEDREIKKYTQRLRDTNALLKCFTTEQTVPGGQKDPAMNLLFTK